MKSWLQQHRRSAWDAVARMGAQPAATLAAAAVMALAVLLPLLGSAIVQAARQLSGGVDRDPIITLYLSASATEDMARQVGAQLRANPAAAAVNFLPKAKALEELKSRDAWRDLLDGLETNPLPDAFAVRLHSRDSGGLASLRQEWGNLPGVERVSADSEWVETVSRVARFGERLVWGAALVLGLAVLAVVAQLTRMQVVMRRSEIELSQLIGASPTDVRRPFLWHGLLQGALAGLLAWLAAAAILLVMADEVRALTFSYATEIAMDFRMLPGFLAVCAGTGAIGLGGAALAVAREVRRFGAAR